jgi:hypothetical protein
VDKADIELDNVRWSLKAIEEGVDCEVLLNGDNSTAERVSCKIGIPSAMLFVSGATGVEF